MFEFGVLGSTLKALSEKAIELLKEGERKRGLFFDSVVEPLHKHFVDLRTGHTKTFEDVYRLVETESDGQQKALELVRRRNYTEAHTWEVLYLVAKDPELNPRSELVGAFAEFTTQLVRLISEEISQDQPVLIAYYNGLMDLLRRDEAILADDVEEELPLSLSRDMFPVHLTKPVLLKEIEKLHRKFVTHCAQEEASYLKLRRLCKG